MERTHVTLHISAPHQAIQEALLSERPMVGRLLAGCMILPVECLTDQRPAYSRSQLTSGYDQWRQMVIDVFTARRHGSRMRFQLDDAHHAALMKLNQELLNRLAELPEPLRARFRPLLALPYRLMWGRWRLRAGADTARSSRPLS